MKASPCKSSKNIWNSFLLGSWSVSLRLGDVLDCLTLRTRTGDSCSGLISIVIVEGALRRVLFQRSLAPHLVDVLSPLKSGQWQGFGSFFAV